MKYDNLIKEEKEIYRYFVNDICKSIIKKVNAKKISDFSGLLISDEVSNAASSMLIAWRKIK